MALWGESGVTYDRLTCISTLITDDLHMQFDTFLIVPATVQLHEL